MERTRIGSGAPWEAIVGYSRVVRVGQQVFVAGTTATDVTGAVVGATAYEQAQQALRNIESALERCGAQMADVVRTRMYVVNIEDGRRSGERTARSSARSARRRRWWRWGGDRSGDAVGDRGGRHHRTGNGKCAIMFARVRR